MIELTVSIVIQGIVIAVFLATSCLLIEWIIYGTPLHRCQRRLFDIGTLFCARCFRLYLKISIALGGSERTALAFAHSAAASYAFSLLMAMNNDIAFIPALIAGWFLSIFAVGAAYDFSSPPPISVTRTVFFLGILCLLATALTFDLTYIYCVLVTGLVGIYTVLIAGFMYMMNCLSDASLESGQAFGEDPGEEFGEDPGEEFGEDPGEEFGEDSGEEFGENFGDNPV